MRVWEIVSDGGIESLQLNDRDIPVVQQGQVLVEIRASSLNYRDLMMIKDPIPRGVKFPRIPNSDGAGEVLSVGSGVTRFKPGDRVAGCFFNNWSAGGVTLEAMASALGGALDGVLAEQVVFDEAGLVAVPKHLSFTEASCLPCAALTAWNALVEQGQLKAGETVLLLGTGGVSVFGLQIATMHGARPIVTSSSKEKLAFATDLGAWATINYIDEPDWDKRVLELTEGHGVDHVVEVSGAGTLVKSINATRIGGHIALIGVLTGGQIDPVNLMRKSIRLNGIYVGSRQMFQAMNKAIQQIELRPIIDRTFSFKHSKEALHYMENASHFGKIVIEM